MEIVAAQLRAHLGIDNVIQTALGPGLIPYRLQVFQRILDPPFGVIIHNKSFLILGQNFRRCAVVIQQPFFKHPQTVNDRNLEMQARLADYAHRLAELGDYHLLRFPDPVNRAGQAEQGQNDNNDHNVKISCHFNPSLYLKYSRMKDSLSPPLY